MATNSKIDPFQWRGRPVRGLLFDMDGTIADTKHVHADAWVVWAARHKLDISREEYLREYFGRSNNDVLPLLLPHLAHDPEALRQLGMEKEHDFLDLLRSGVLPATAGLHDVVQRAHVRGLGMAIASAAPRENVETVADHYGLSRFIPVRLSMDDVERAKPAPDLFLEAARRLGLDPADCVVMEDSKHGLHAGRAAGCRTIAVLSLHESHELEECADLCVADFAELLALDEWRGF